MQNCTGLGARGESRQSLKRRTLLGGGRMSIEALREVVSRLNTSANALAALGAALRQRVTGLPLDASLEPHVAAVATALGVHDALGELTPAEARSLSGEIRTFALSNAKLVCFDTPGAGWQHREAELLQAAGDVSSTVPQRLARAIAPLLAGLPERLQAPGSAFLDVGVGVAALSIEMARLWPSLRIVGIDPWAPALALAHGADARRGDGPEPEGRLR